MKLNYYFQVFGKTHFKTYWNKSAKYNFKTIYAEKNYTFILIN